MKKMFLLFTGLLLICAEMAIAKSKCSHPVVTQSDALCVVNEDLSYLKKMKFSENVSKAHLGLFGSHDSESMSAYVSPYLARMTFMPDFPAVAGWVESSQIMYLGSDFFAEENRILRLSILIHEAYHAKHPESDHIQCSSPHSIIVNNKKYIFKESPLSGAEEMCDQDFEGSMGASLTFLMSVAESCLNCVKQDKTTSLHKALFDSLMRINGPGGLNHALKQTSKNADDYLNNFDSLFRRISKEHAQMDGI